MKLLRYFAACLLFYVGLAQPVTADSLRSAREICGYEKGNHAPRWNPMSDEARQYIGPMDSAPSPLFEMEEEYPAGIQKEADLWQLMMAMNRELCEQYTYNAEAVASEANLKKWVDRVNKLVTWRVRYQTWQDGRQKKVTFYAIHSTDMRAYAAFRNPDLVKKLTQTERRMLDSCCEWIENNISVGMPNLLKIKKVHDAIADGTTYTKGHYTSHELILDGKGVCASYTTACQLLLHMLKIDCRYVHGTVTTSKTETHAWNLVDVNGEWYHMDTTWDDPEDNCVYTYFLITDEEMRMDHDWPIQGQDPDVYPQTPVLNPLHFYMRRYTSYTDGQERGEDTYYTDDGCEVIERLFENLPGGTGETIQKSLPAKPMGRVVESARKIEDAGRQLLGMNRKESEEKEQEYNVRTMDELNKLLEQCAEKLEGPSISFTVDGTTNSARDMLNASDIHKYVRRYSVTSSERLPYTPGPRITITVEYWPYVRLANASRNRDAEVKLSANERAALHACRKLAESFGSAWKLERQKVRDAYEYLTTRVQWSAKECDATAALLKKTGDSLGYATTLHILCVLMDIPCRVVHGRTDKDLHVWNMVRRTGKRWFHADAGMDSMEDNRREYQWDYYMECDVDFIENHVWHLDEHPETPPGNLVKKKALHKQLQRLRSQTGLP